MIDRLEKAALATPVANLPMDRPQFPPHRVVDRRLLKPLEDRQLEIRQPSALVKSEEGSAGRDAHDRHARHAANGPRVDDNQRGCLNAMP